MQNKRILRNTRRASGELLSSSLVLPSHVAPPQIDGSKLDDANGGAFVVRPLRGITRTFLLIVAFQSYVANSPNTFRQVEGRLRFTESIPSRSLHLARRSNLLNQFGDFDDYLEDNTVQYLTNRTVEAELNLLQ